jgi:flagellar basal-body rod protein FlgB
MPVQGIFGTTVELLGKTLDLRAKRQELISANLANVDTPGYTPSDISFEAELKGALQNGGQQTPATSMAMAANPRFIPLKGRGGSATLDQVRGDLVEIPGKNTGPDGNGVEMEGEMERMVQNEIMYNASVQLLTKKFEMMKQAIKGTL